VQTSDPARIWTKIVLTVAICEETLLNGALVETTVRAGQVLLLANHAEVSEQRMGIASVGAARGRKGKPHGTRNAHLNMTTFVGNVSTALEVGGMRQAGCSMRGAEIVNSTVSVITTVIVAGMKRIRSGWIRGRIMKIKRVMSRLRIPWKNFNAGKRG
jgi:hypothetical protein